MKKPSKKLYDRAEVIQKHFHASMDIVNNYAKSNNVSTQGYAELFNACLYTKLAELEIKIEELTAKINPKPT